MLKHIVLAIVREECLWLIWNAFQRQQVSNANDNTNQAKPASPNQMLQDIQLQYNNRE